MFGGVVRPLPRGFFFSPRSLFALQTSFPFAELAWPSNEGAQGGQRRRSRWKKWVRYPVGAYTPMAGELVDGELARFPRVRRRGRGLKRTESGSWHASTGTLVGALLYQGYYPLGVRPLWGSMPACGRFSNAGLSWGCSGLPWGGAL